MSYTISDEDIYKNVLIIVRVCLLASCFLTFSRIMVGMFNGMCPGVTLCLALMYVVIAFGLFGSLSFFCTGHVDHAKVNKLANRSAYIYCDDDVVACPTFTALGLKLCYPAINPRKLARLVGEHLCQEQGPFF